MAGVGLCVEIHIPGPQFWPESGLAGLEPSICFQKLPNMIIFHPWNVGRIGTMTFIT